jgi:hypothetical protein
MSRLDLLGAHWTSCENIHEKGFYCAGKNTVPRECTIPNFRCHTQSHPPQSEKDGSRKPRKAQSETGGPQAVRFSSARGVGEHSNENASDSEALRFACDLRGAEGIGR